MENEKEYLYSKYMPGRRIESIAVAFAMHHRLTVPSPSGSLCAVCDVLGISTTALKDLIEQAPESKLLKDQRPDRLSQLVEIHAGRYENFLKCIERESVVMAADYRQKAVDVEQLAMAKHFLSNHNNNGWRRHIVTMMGLENIEHLDQLMTAAKDKSIMRKENEYLLRDYIKEMRPEYDKFLQGIDDAKYIHSDLIHGRKVEDVTVGFAVNYMQKHPDPEDKERVLNMLKLTQPALDELYEKARKRPLLSKFLGGQGLGKLAQVQFSRYQTFVRRVTGTDRKIAAESGGIIERLIPMKDMGAALYLMKTGELSADQICDTWGMSRASFDNAVEKMSNDREYKKDYLDDVSKHEEYYKTIQPNIEALRQEAIEEMVLGMPINGQPPVNINTTSEEERKKLLQYHPDVFAGLDKEHTTREYALLACRANGLALEHVATMAPRLVNRELCLEAVKSQGAALRFVPRRFRDREMCYAAVANDNWAYRYVPRGIKSERKMIHLACNRHGGGFNINFMFEKDKSKYICFMAKKTFDAAEDYFPKKFAPSDRELKRQEMEAREAQREQPARAEEAVRPDIRVLLADYFDLHPDLDGEARMKVAENFGAVQGETEDFVGKVADFYNGKLTAEELLDTDMLKGRCPTDEDPCVNYRNAVIATYSIAERHPEAVEGLAEYRHFQPVTERDFSGLTFEDVQQKVLDAGAEEGNGRVKSVGEWLDIMETLPENYKAGLVQLHRQEAELAIAYRNGEITAADYLSTLPVGTEAPKASQRDLRILADDMTGYWAEQYPDLVRQTEETRHTGMKR